MGGLAIGSAVWGRKADKISRPLFLYGWLEFGIGAYCLLYPLIIRYVKEIFIQSVISLALHSDGGAVLGLKLVVSLLTGTSSDYFNGGNATGVGKNSLRNSGGIGKKRCGTLFP